MELRSQAGWSNDRSPASHHHYLTGGHPLPDAPPASRANQVDRCLRRNGWRGDRQYKETKMITKTTRDHRTATSIEEMHQVAQNQITFKIDQLKERIELLKELLPRVVDVVDSTSYNKIIVDVAEYDDDDDLTALDKLAEHYFTMQAGNYF